MEQYGQRGFTLVEVMITMAVFSVGILGMITMLTSSVGGNAKADVITSAATVAADRLELLMALPYNDPLLQDDPTSTGNFLGAAGLRNPFPTLPAMEIADPANFPADYQINTPDGEYVIYWNVAVDFPTNNTKTVQVLVVSTRRGEQKTVTLRYVIAEII